jgi:class 3 adenylate cyclase
VRTANLAIVFTEIVGYADRLSRQTYEQSQRMLRLHEALVVPVFRAYQGRRVKTIGGTLLVAFESPTQAVLCGAAVQDRIWDWNRNTPESERIKVRVAVNVGEVRLEKGDVFGEPVNICARVLGLADASEVLFTEAIWLSMNRNEIEADDGGQQQLKGVPEAVRVFRVRPAPDPAVRPYGGRALARAGKLRIPDPTKLTSAEVRGHLRAAAESAWGHVAEAFPWLADQARTVALGAMGAVLILIALLLAPDAVERALARQDLQAVQREVQAMRAGPRRTYYEGRLQEARKDWDGAARSYEVATRAGERRAFERLLDMAKAGRCDARVAAAHGLGKLGDQEALSTLQKMANEEARAEPQDGLLAHVLGCQSKTAARDALEQIRGTP